MSYKRKKILAVASIGGHWIQLLRITGPLERSYNLSYCSTNDSCRSMVPGHDFYSINDFNRKNIWRIAPALVSSFSILRRVRPDALITTGAAPGLIMLAVARLMGIRTIWIDSIANVERLSTSGKLASKLASRTYTQWAHLQRPGEVFFSGNVFG